jgi:carbamoyl-phosphate synthase small subunit
MTGPSPGQRARAAGQAGGRPGILVLEDGATFHGTGFGADGETFGEMVFNTGMTGYQETLTDPSYARQIVAMTAPHIGNTGVNDEDAESRQIWVSGYVVREPARIASSWRARRSLDEELAAQGVPGIAITGTRALTRHLRERGAMRAAIATADGDQQALLSRVQASPSMLGADLAREVSTAAPYTVYPPPGAGVRYRVTAVDLGIKAATPRSMARRGCRVQVVPATSTADEILATGPDGVFFSNGPGDPAAVGYAVEAMREVLAEAVPLFGICLGSQILGRALGLGTYKLRFGHRGVNQPVKDLASGRVQITSHNHGFAVALQGAGAGGGPGEGAGGEPGEGAGSRSGEGAGSRSAAAPARTQASPAALAPFETPFGRAQVSHINLNDGVVEGLRLLDVPAFGVQYHPEAAPGPHDAAGEFDAFCALMDRAQ